MSDDLLRLASSLAIEAGDMVRAGRRAGVVAAETKSSTTDMVTEFDRASEQLLVTRIRATRPHDGIVGEEGSSTVGTSGVSWLIDPIDGTTNFLYDIPAWAVSVAAVDAEGPLAAAVYAPALGELFTARRGGGATLNGVPIACGRSADLSTSLVATGFSYVAARRVEQAARVARMIGHVRDVRRFGAASLDLCFVAMGRLDGYFEEDLGPWDLAAGQLVATEAGCRTGDFSGGAIRPGQALVANPSLFADLADLIERSSG
ncbi:MAG: inositol monophosphatase family protein [Actinomycetota bacterium]|jgi:myo-inositol-1(or 4)-monophosphatase